VVTVVSGGARVTLEVRGRGEGREPGVRVRRAVGGAVDAERARVRLRDSIPIRVGRGKGVEAVARWLGEA